MNTVFLFDVDNTLLDNDRVTRDLKNYLLREVGTERAERYWRIFEELRSELGYADYLGAAAAISRRVPIRVALVDGLDLSRQLSVRQPAFPELT